MHAMRRCAAALAATVVLAGCADSSGDTAVPDPDAGTAAEPQTDSGGDPDDGDGDDDGTTSADSGDDGAWTAEEIAAAFNAHSGTQADLGPAGEAREFPDGITPSHLRIPAIGVDASVIELSLAGSEPEVPEDFDQVGWYQQTRKPGEIGPAVLAGHIDSRSGPAVFVDLDELSPGDEIVVVGEDGEERRFVVDALGQYPKDDLPDEVFGFGDAEPDLRLITCGGEFDRSSGHYRDNLVVYASLADA